MATRREQVLRLARRQDVAQYGISSKYLTLLTEEEHGVEEHEIQRVRIRVYGPTKTVADCFKYRNKIGLDVAIEAVRDTWRQRRATMDELWKAARVCRVDTVMKPYLESLT